MMSLAEQLNDLLGLKGKIFIEGKCPDDHKISRSKLVASNLALDQQENGHLRRIWDEGFVKKLCKKINWDILKLEKNLENWDGAMTSFLRLLAQKGAV
jgi:hypothetical protein